MPDKGSVKACMIFPVSNAFNLLKVLVLLAKSYLIIVVATSKDFMFSEQNLHSNCQLRHFCRSRNTKYG
jgi:hypothetical protein